MRKIQKHRRPLSLFPGEELLDMEEAELASALDNIIMISEEMSASSKRALALLEHIEQAKALA